LLWERWMQCIGLMRCVFSSPLEHSKMDAMLSLETLQAWKPREHPDYNHQTMTCVALHFHFSQRNTFYHALIHVG
jgi:hypothetical protein